MMGIQIIANLIVDYHRIETIKKRVQNGIVNWACPRSGLAGRLCFTHILSEEVIIKTICNMYNIFRVYEDDILKSTLN